MGIEQVIERRARPWKLYPPAAEPGKDGKWATDAYGRPIRTPRMPKVIRGFDAPLYDAKTSQEDIGHVTRGERVLFVVLDKSVRPEDVRVGCELEDAEGVRWGVVSVENWADKIRPGRGKFLRVEISRRALQ